VRPHKLARPSPCPPAHSQGPLCNAKTVCRGTPYWERQPTLPKLHARRWGRLSRPGGCRAAPTALLRSRGPALVTAVGQGRKGCGPYVPPRRRRAVTVPKPQGRRDCGGVEAATQTRSPPPRPRAAVNCGWHASRECFCSAPLNGLRAGRYPETQEGARRAHAQTRERHNPGSPDRRSRSRGVVGQRGGSPRAGQGRCAGTGGSPNGVGQVSRDAKLCLARWSGGVAGGFPQIHRPIGDTTRQRPLPESDTGH
jgi:hypothetical protein